MNTTHLPSLAVVRRRMGNGGSAFVPVNFVIAGTDGASAARGATVSIDLLANDRNGDGSTSNLQVVPGSLTAPAFGVVTLRPDQRTVDFVMPADAAINALATFTYVVRNTVTGASAVGVVNVRCVLTSVSATNDSISILAAAPPRTVPVLDNDDPSELLEVTNVTALTPNLGSLVIAPNTRDLIYTPPASIAAATDVVANYTATVVGGGLSATAQFKATVSPAGGTPADAYNYINQIPNLAALDTSRIKMWDMTKALPAHNAGDIIVAMAPNTPLRGNLAISGIKGCLLICGATFYPEGGVIWANYDSDVKGCRYLMNISFSNDAKCHYDYTVDGRTTNWPWFMWANCYIDFSVNGAHFGDLIRIQVQDSPANDPVTHRLRGTKLVAFYNKIYMAKGPHYVSKTHGIDGENGHSDGIQDYGGVPIFKFAQSHMDWVAGQLQFYGRDSEECGFSRETQWSNNRVTMQHSPKWFSKVQTHVLQTNPCYFQSYEGRGDGELSDYASGKYLAKRFDGDCIIRGPFNVNDATNVKQYLSPKEGVSYNTTTGKFTFSTDVKGDHTFPHHSGDNKLRYIKNGTAFPFLGCDPDETGMALRITSKADFMSKFGLS